MYTGMRQKKNIIAMLMTLGILSNAQAGDMGPSIPDMNWTGFYIGANGGWGWSHYNASINPFGTIAIDDITPVSFSTQTNGPVFGGQIGYNYMFNSAQLDNVVLGVEFDWDGTGIEGFQQTNSLSKLSLIDVPNGTSNNLFSETENTNWLTSIRGRLGKTWKSAMVYATAGGAWRQTTHNIVGTANVVSSTAWSQEGFGKNTNITGGYIVGGGLEWMAAPHWLIRGEYLYYGVPSTITSSIYFPHSFTANSGYTATTSDSGVNVVRLAASYKI